MDDKTEPTDERRVSWDMVGEPDTRRKKRTWVDRELKVTYRMVHRGYEAFWRRRGLNPPPVSTSYLIFGNFYND